MKLSLNLSSSLSSNSQYLLFLLIFILSLVPRVIDINNLPPSLNWDEISHGYNAYSILKTGRDEWDKFLPLIFRAYGDYKLPVYIYLSIVPILFLGLNPLSIRLISILSGSITPIFIYLFFQKLTKSKFKSFLASLVYSLSPWTIFLSRIALEANLFLFLFVASIYFFCQKKYSLSLVLYAFCLFTYNSSRVLLPFFLILIIFSLLKSNTKLKKNIFGLTFFALSIIIFISQSLDSSGQARYKWVSLLDQGAINTINQFRSVYPRFLVNKLTYFLFVFFQNYISHFNPLFLFKNGGSHYQFNIPEFYLLTPVLILPFLVGIKTFFKSKLYLPLLIFFLSPLPSSITRDAPYTLRSIVFVATATFISIYGLVVLFNKKIIYAFFAILIVTISQIQFWHRYQEYGRTYSRYWQYGYKQVVDFTKLDYSKYNKFYITKFYGEPHEFFLFYWPWPPRTYQNSANKTWRYQTDWYWIDAFDKFQFVNDWDIAKLTIPPNSLLITSPGNYPLLNSKIIKSIYFLDQTPAFDIVEYE